MSETATEYWLVDEDGDRTKAVFVQRFCGCMVPGCVDDELQIFVDGPDDVPCRLQVPRLVSGYLKGLLDGDIRGDAASSR